jgi:hypothetical protein
MSPGILQSGSKLSSFSFDFAFFSTTIAALGNVAAFRWDSIYA